MKSQLSSYYVFLLTLFFWCILTSSVFGQSIADDSNLSVPQFFASGSRLLVGEQEGRVEFWDTSSLKIVRSFDIGRLDPKDNGIRFLARKSTVSPNGKHLVVSTGYFTNLTSINDRGLLSEESREPEGDLQVWNAETGKFLRSLRPPKNEPQAGFGSSGAISNDSRFLALFHNGKVLIWKLDTGEFLRALPWSNYARLLYYSPDDALILGGSYGYGNKWYLWDSKRGKMLRRVIGDERTVLLGFTAHGKAIKGQMQQKNGETFGALWSTQTGKLISKSKKNILYSPDGKVGVNPTKDSASILDAKSGKLLHSLMKDENSYPSNWEWIFSSDNKLLLARSGFSSGPGEVAEKAYLWDLQTGTLKKTWIRHSPSTLSEDK